MRAVPQIGVAKADEPITGELPSNINPPSGCLSNLTPADVYFGRGQSILLERERIKRKTIEHRRLQHRKAAA